MAKKILVINDEEPIREVTRMVLQQNHYDVVLACNGQEGIAAAKANLPDLILLDIMMPGGMDGYDTCREFKKDPQIKDIPVIFLSSLTSPKDKIKGLETGGVDFINNIGDKGEFLARIETHLKIKSLTQALMTTNQQLLDKQKSLDDDLKAAALIQRSFLPPPCFTLENFNIAWTCVPCNPVGGDSLNIMPLNEDKVACYMLDVSGHDVPSAMVTVSVSQYLHQQNTTHGACLSPKEMMKALDKEYPMERFDRYFTIFYMTLDLKQGQISYSSAGHPPAIWLKPNANFQLLSGCGTIIGINEFGSGTYDQWDAKLENGDKLFLYTDGVTEYPNAKGELFGQERFIDLLEKNKKENLSKIIYIIQETLKDFGQENIPRDDISMLGLEYTSK